MQDLHASLMLVLIQYMCGYITSVILCVLNLTAQMEYLHSMQQMKVKVNRPNNSAPTT